jgi:hypothetical protein
MVNHKCHINRGPIGQKPYALAAVEALLPGCELYENHLRSRVIAEASGYVPTRKTVLEKRDVSMFYRTMKNLKDKGIVNTTQYGIAPNREKTYELSKGAKARLILHGAKTRAQIAAALEI